jgi:hypothetical protein
MKPKDHYKNLIRLAALNGPIGSDSINATVNRPEWFERNPAGDVAPRASRRRLHEVLAARFVNRIGNLKYSREAIVMAGPPGAGKTTALHAVLARDIRSSEHFAVIDADTFKADLLQSAIEDGWYEQLVPNQVADLERLGETFFPMDFAPLVHIESTILARTVTRQLLAAGANIVIDGTLSGTAAARETFDMRAKHSTCSRLPGIRAS